ncbi:unnamed protein product [Nezara viridula]|uniref:Uncharacterized protein n=1 Tax=Nezara viridula TaxID=85310 RepID=A0A9P0MXY0_NEZVI|nr:unnamed protein product [Nezara viridula]
MLAFVVVMTVAVAGPILLADKSAQIPLHKFYQVDKVELDTLLALPPPEITRDIERRKRAEDMSGMPMPIPPRLQPPPYIFVLPATTPGHNSVYVLQSETEKEKLGLSTAKQPDVACHICPIELERHKVLSSNKIESCCGSLLEPVDPYPNAQKEIKKRVNFGNIYSYKWEFKRQNKGKISGSLELPRLKTSLTGSKASKKRL